MGSKSKKNQYIEDRIPHSGTRIVTVGINIAIKGAAVKTASWTVATEKSITKMSAGKGTRKIIKRAFKKVSAEEAA